MNLWFLFNMTLLTKVVELFYYFFSNKLAEDIFCAGILKFGLHFNLPSCSSSVPPFVYQLVFYTFNAIISRKGVWLPNSMLQNHPDPIGLKGNIYFLIERIHWLGLWHFYFSFHMETRISLLIWLHVGTVKSSLWYILHSCVRHCCQHRLVSSDFFLWRHHFVLCHPTSCCMYVSKWDPPMV